MRIDKKIENYILEFYFNHLAIMKFRSFGSWRIQIEPQMGVWMEEKKEREKKREVQNSIFEIHKWTQSSSKICFKLFIWSWDYIFLCHRGFSLQRNYNYTLRTFALDLHASEPCLLGQNGWLVVASFF